MRKLRIGTRGLHRTVKKLWVRSESERLRTNEPKLADTAATHLDERYTNHVASAAVVWVVLEVSAGWNRVAAVRSSSKTTTPSAAHTAARAAVFRVAVCIRALAVTARESLAVVVVVAGAPSVHALKAGKAGVHTETAMVLVSF
jgi:hypothetical protein